MTFVEDLSFNLSTAPIREQHSLTEPTHESLRDLRSCFIPERWISSTTEEVLVSIIRYNLHRYAHHLLSVLVLTTFLATPRLFHSVSAKKARLRRTRICLPAICMVPHFRCQRPVHLPSPPDTSDLRTTAENHLII